eukprot:8438431-Pyramimonas_sp.AAC.1
MFEQAAPLPWTRFYFSREANTTKGHPLQGHTFHHLYYHFDVQNDPEGYVVYPNQVPRDPFCIFQVSIPAPPPLSLGRPEGPGGA